LCKDYNLSIIEDAAHAAGTKYGGKKIGSHGNAVCFSFHPVKNLAMPSGGAITINKKIENENLQKLYSRRWCGISNRIGPKYDVKELGWNYYLNEFSAAIGIEQLKKLDKMNAIRRKIAQRYSKEISIKNKMPFNKDYSYHLYWILVRERDEFIKKMKKNRIEVGIHYLPIHTMKFYSSKIRLPITENIAKKIVSIPMHPNLKPYQVDKIIKLVNEFASD